MASPTSEWNGFKGRRHGLRQATCTDLILGSTADLLGTRRVRRANSHRERARGKSRAAHIFRCRPDGTGLEPVLTGGMDNPVDVAFTPDGERVFRPRSTRFSLVSMAWPHAIYGGVYGKDHGVLSGHAPGELMPTLVAMSRPLPAAWSGTSRTSSARNITITCSLPVQHAQSFARAAAVGKFVRERRQRFCFVRSCRHPTDVHGC